MHLVPYEEEVGKREERVELPAALREAVVSPLDIAELALEHAMWMFDLRLIPCGGFVPPLVLVAAAPAATGSAYHSPNLALVSKCSLSVGVDIAIVGPDKRLLTVQQHIPDLIIMNLAVVVSLLCAVLF